MDHQQDRPRQRERAYADPIDPESLHARAMSDETARRANRRAPPQPPQPARPSARTRLRQRLSRPEKLRETLLLSEILGPPRALRDPEAR